MNFMPFRHATVTSWVQSCAWAGGRGTKCGLEEVEEEVEEEAKACEGADTGSGIKHIFSPSQRWPHQQRPSALMMHVPVPQHLGSFDMGLLLKSGVRWIKGCLKTLQASRRALYSPAVALAFSQAIKMRSGVAGASM